MSSEQATKRTQTPTDGTRDRLVTYLESKAAHGEFQCKSTFIAEDLGLPAWEVTMQLFELAESSSELDIEELSYSRSTTWRVTRSA